MSLLQSITKGKTPKPPRIIVYGTEGVGKSTLASQAPNPIFIQTEDGINEIDCAKFPLSHTFEEVMSELNALLNEPHDYQTVVVDSLSGLEPMIWREVCCEAGVNTIERVEGGFGKGYIIALKWWERFRDVLQALNDKRGMIVILIAHMGVMEVKDPEAQTYDRTCPRLHKKAVAVMTQWADAIFQAKQKFRIQKTGTGLSERGIAVPTGADGGERVLRTVGNAAVVAKNRWQLPSEIPLSWNAFMKAYQKAASGGESHV